jgi:hypothetical protein
VSDSRAGKSANRTLHVARRRERIFMFCLSRPSVPLTRNENEKVSRILLFSLCSLPPVNRKVGHSMMIWRASNFDRYLLRPPVDCPVAANSEHRPQLAQLRYFQRSPYRRRPPVVGWIWLKVQAFSEALCWGPHGLTGLPVPVGLVAADRFSRASLACQPKL